MPRSRLGETRHSRTWIARARAARSEASEVLHLAPEVLQRLDANVGVRKPRRVEALIATERPAELAANPGFGRVIRVWTEAVVAAPERAFAAGPGQAQDLGAVGAELDARRQRGGVAELGP